MLAARFVDCHPSHGRPPFKTFLKLAHIAALGLLAACGTTPGERAVTGGLGGALIGGGTGAVLGAGVSAATTSSRDRDYCRDHPC